MEAVNIVTIKNKIPLFKGEEKANSIELIEFEENEFKVVSQIGLYNIGDKAVYIQPDYCLVDNKLFEDFIRPYGDPSKSKLGSNYRIRAVKFNLHTGDNFPVYSIGILLPKEEVDNYIQRDCNVEDLTEILGIVKWEEPDKPNSHGLNVGKSRPFPEGVYKTDEDNINNVISKLKFPVYLIGTEKIDGSSITIGSILRHGKRENFICSRNLSKPLTVKKVVGKKRKTILHYIKEFFGFKTDLNIYLEQDNDDDFVKYGKPILESLINYCEKSKLFSSVILRGELSGGSLKGSGNKHNPARKEPANIKIFGMDVFEDGKCERHQAYELFCNELFNVVTVPKVFEKAFSTKEDLFNECNAYFRNNMIEGIVIRTSDCQFSAKVMNPEYDSKK